MEIPSIIRTAASGYLNIIPGAKLKALGDYEGSAAFYVKLPDGRYIGYPVVFLLNDGEITEINGEQALRIIASFS